MTVTIRPMKPGEACAVAALHRTGIPQGFLSQLAPGFLTAIYRGIASAPRAGVWVAISSDRRVVGFIAGTANVQACYRYTLVHQLPAIVWHFLPSLASLATWRKAWNTLTYPRREIQRRPQIAKPEPSAELLSIVVAAETRGTGASTRLVCSLEDGLRSWGHRGCYRVVTDAGDPRSHAFYIKTGFVPVREFLHHQHQMILYHKELPLERLP